MNDAKRSSSFKLLLPPFFPELSNFHSPIRSHFHVKLLFSLLSFFFVRRLYVCVFFWIAFPSSASSSVRWNTYIRPLRAHPRCSLAETEDCQQLHHPQNVFSAATGSARAAPKAMKVRMRFTWTRWLENVSPNNRRPALKRGRDIELDI